MTETTIRCDHCRKVLAPDVSVPRFQIVVRCLPMAPTSAVRAMVHVVPPLDRPLDFCALECLRAYLNDDGGNK